MYAVAAQFFKLGYNTFVLVYTNNVTLEETGVRLDEYVEWASRHDMLSFLHSFFTMKT